MIKHSFVQKYIQQLLDKADIRLNGDRPQDIQLLDERALKSITHDGSLGLGESYMEGWWECEHLDEFSYQLCIAGMDKKARVSFLHALYNLANKLFNFQTKHRARQVAYKHYNIDNHLFELMLGESMAYSCAYWKNANDLDTAQKAKYDLICRKLHLNSQDTLLDIGCGWGGLAAYAAENYGCRVTGISIAASQISFAKARYKHLPVEFHVADYRDTTLYNPEQKQFSKLVSVGAFEHIGHKNYKIFLNLMNKQLNDKGLFLLHTIGSNETVTTADRWFTKYIFPNGSLPSMVQLTHAMEHAFLVEDWHNFGIYYDKTLLAWHKNFEKNWHALSPQFDRHFYRMWRYYLLMCAGMFRSRTAQLWQIVLSKTGLKEGYESIR